MAEENGDSLRSSENVIESSEPETPEVTIEALRQELVAKTARVQELEMKVEQLEQLEPIALLAKDFYFEMKKKLGNYGETVEEMAGAAELEAELEAQQDGNASISPPDHESTN